MLRRAKCSCGERADCDRYTVSVAEERNTCLCHSATLLTDEYTHEAAPALATQGAALLWRDDQEGERGRPAL